MLIYLGIYVAALLHSDRDTFSLIEAGKYFVPPIFALAVAWAAFDPVVRKRLVVLSIAAVALQIPIVLIQTVDNIAERGRDAIDGVDFITGLLGSRAPGTLTQAGIFAAVLLLAAGYLRVVPPRLAVPGGLALVLLGALSSTRVSYMFVPLALGAVAAAWMIWARAGRDRATARTVIALPILVVPLLVLLTGALYPGANNLFGSGGYLEQTISGDPGLQVQAQEDVRTTRLPGRIKQVTLSLELSVDGGPARALLGRGIGATRFKSQPLLSSTGATTDPITREEQKTNGLWVSRVITETGYLGLLAFLSLLTYLVALTARNRALLRSPSWDSVALLALPGIAGLTLASAFFNTVLANQPYATLFWALAGVAIAIDAGRRVGPFHGAQAGAETGRPS